MHAASTFPEECCGFLLGVADDAARIHVHRVLPARNEHPDRRDCRYLIPPETVLAARREARGLGLEVVGYYHSHTDGSGEPSEHDLADAWPATSYLIVPVEDGKAGPPRSWRLADEGDGFVEEAVARAGDGSPGAPASVGETGAGVRAGSRAAGQATVRT